MPLSGNNGYERAIIGEPVVWCRIQLPAGTQSRQAGRQLFGGVPQEKQIEDC